MTGRTSESIDSIPRDPNALLYTSIHEAGHAVTALDRGFKLISVDVRRRKLANGAEVNGTTNLEPVKTDDIRGKGEKAVMPSLIVALAGGIAESIVNPHIEASVGRNQDLREAYEMAGVMCHAIDRGAGMEITAEEMKRNKPRLDALHKSAILAAAEIVDKNYPAIEKVAKLLRERQELSGDDVADIVSDGQGSAI